MGKDAPSPGVEFLIALAGPVVSLLIGLLTGGLFLLVRQSSEPAGAVLLWLAGVNLSLGLFNLLPGFPLDGGRLVRAAAWYAADDFRWATRVATRAGQLAAMTLIAAGTFLAFFERPASLANGIWLMLIGWFLLSAASGSYQATLLLQTLQGVLTRDVARRDPLLVEASITLSELAQLLLEQPGRAPAVVLRDGVPIGLVDHTALRRVRSGQFADTKVVDTMRALDDELLMADDLPASQALQLLLENGLESLPVVASGQVVGVIRRDDLLRLTEIRRRLSR
jgi:CBS domain-containing protein